MSVLGTLSESWNEFWERPKTYLLPEYKLYIEKIKIGKNTTKQFEQSRERLQVELLLFTLNKNSPYIKLSRP